MILFIDDEDLRTLRWRELLAELLPLTYASSAAAALQHLGDPVFRASLRLVVVDLAMHTTGPLTPEETGLGRLTGEALRRRIRAIGWSGPIILLTNARDDLTRTRVEHDGDHFVRKAECPPTELKRLAAELLGIKDPG